MAGLPDPRHLAHRTRLVAEDYAYAAYWNMRGLVDPRTPEDYLTGERAPIVAIPGIYETWRFLTPVIEALHNDGHPVHVFPELRRNHNPVLKTAEMVSEQIRERDLHNVVIFGHSKGGLVGKYIMQRLDPDRRINHMIAVCSPFSGSGLARYVWWTPHLRVFSPNSPVTRGLAAYRDVNARITSIYSRYDPHIPEGSELVGATNIRLPIDGHFQILANPLLRDTIMAALTKLSPDDGQTSHDGHPAAGSHS